MCAPRGSPPPAKFSPGQRGRRRQSRPWSRPRSASWCDRWKRRVSRPSASACRGASMPVKAGCCRAAMSISPACRWPRRIAAATQRPVFVDNDGNMALFAEHAVGAARSATNGRHVHDRHRHRRRRHRRRGAAARPGVGGSARPHHRHRRRQVLLVRPAWLRRDDELRHRARTPHRRCRPCFRNVGGNAACRDRRTGTQRQRPCLRPGPRRCASPSTRWLRSSIPTWWCSAAASASPCIRRSAAFPPRRRGINARSCRRASAIAPASSARA